MLVLSRKMYEKIYIGENIIITVIDIERGKVKIGIEAPKEVAILREELDKVGESNATDNTRDNKEASNTTFCKSTEVP